MKLGDIKIGHRLGLGFALVLIITGIIGIVANANINKMWHITEDMYRHPFTVSKAVRDIKTNIIAMHRSMKDVALALDDRQINEAKSKVDEYERQVFKSFNIVFDRFLGEMGDARTAYDAFVNWKPIRDEVIQLQYAGKKNEAAAITKDKGADYVSYLNDKIQIMIDFANKKGDSFYNESTIVKNETINNSLILLLSVVLLGFIVAMFITRSIIKPLSSMSEVSKRLKEGELSARNINITAEETGVLAQSINELAESIESTSVIQRGVVDISRTMIGHTSLEAFSSKLLKQLMTITSANMSTFYILNETTSEYEHFASVGANKELLKPFNAKNPEGEFGNAISKKSIYYLRDIPKDTVFKFKTTAGEVVPKEIITIPILDDNKVVALISLANIHKFSKENLNIINQSLNAFNSSYSTLLANARTRILAENLQKINHRLEAQTEELQVQKEELQTQTEELSQQSEELQEQNIELEEQRKQISSANRLKSEFLANMSHELRTPLNSVIALSRVLVDQTKDKLSAEEINYLQVIDRNGKNLLNLINDILDLSKIESGKLDFYFEETNLYEILNLAVDNLEPLANEKKIKLVKKIPSDITHIQTDQKRFLQVVENIVANAIKFTNKGSVTVTARNDNENLYVEVIDTGIGISKTDLLHIFNEFIQADGSSTRQFEGTGLGLAISYKLIKELGGDIKVESKIRKGSKFTIIHPIKLSDDIRDSKALLSADSGIRLNSKSSYEKIDLNIDLTGKRILLVEDNDVATIQIKNLLENEELIIDSVVNGKEALKYIKTTIPDGFILDIMMPEIDGIELLEKLRAFSLTKTIPVIMLTAKDLTQEELATINGNNVYQLIYKGDVNKKELVSLVKGMLKIPTKKSEIKDKEKTAPPISPKVKKRSKVRSSVIPKILVVEDNQDNMTTIEAILKNRCKLLKAFDGKSGLELGKSKKPDLILMDIALPKMEGETVMKKLKSNPATSNIPIIAITAHAMAGDKEKFLSAGFDDYITKPIDPDNIIESINKWVSII